MLAQGTLRPGSRLGTEREMAERFAVSRSTLRSALLPLGRAGVLERRTGRNGGTFVRADVVQRHAAELAGLPARLRSGGHTSHPGLGDRSQARHPAEATALEIDSGAEVFAIRRLRFADGVPLSVDHAASRSSRCPICSSSRSAAPVRVVRGPLPAGASVVDRDHRGGQRQPREAHWLGIPNRRPLLAITRITRDGADRPFEYALRPVPGRPGAADGDDLERGRPRTAGYRRPGGAFREQRLIGRLAWDR